jgi:hypothetical protein
MKEVPMPEPAKKLRVVGELRPKLDVKRFADALVALAAHRLAGEADARSDQTEESTTRESEPTP